MPRKAEEPVWTSYDFPQGWMAGIPFMRKIMRGEKQILYKSAHIREWFIFVVRDTVGREILRCAQDDGAIRKPKSKARSALLRRAGLCRDAVGAATGQDLAATSERGLFASKCTGAGGRLLRWFHDWKSFVWDEGAEWGGNVCLFDVQGGAELFIWSGDGRRIGVFADLSEVRDWVGGVEDDGRAGSGAAGICAELEITALRELALAFGLAGGIFLAGGFYGV
jgi:hypothetical protein